MVPGVPKTGLLYAPDGRSNRKTIRRGRAKVLNEILRTIRRVVDDPIARCVQKTKTTVRFSNFFGFYVGTHVPEI